jgi:hypothetical protein
VEKERGGSERDRKITRERIKEGEN